MNAIARPPRAFRYLPIAPTMPVAAPVSTTKRPKTRGECKDAPRPCHWLSCRYHLALNVSRYGAVTHSDVETMAETCALDVADRGQHDNVYIGGLLGLTKQRIEQIENDALRAIARFDRKNGGALQDHAEGEPDITYGRGA